MNGPNQPWGLRFPPASGLARGLLSSIPVRVMALTLGLLTATGCIVPQDDHVLEPLPDVLNRPPRIIPEQTQPTGTPVVLGNGTNCSKTFSVNVEDPDVGDQISYAFYIDYKPANATNP